MSSVGRSHLLEHARPPAMTGDNADKPTTTPPTVADLIKICDLTKFQIKSRDFQIKSQIESHLVQIESLLLKSNHQKRFNRDLNRIAIWICSSLVSKLKTRVGKRKNNFLALRAKFYQTNVCLPWPETLSSAPLLCGLHALFSGRSEIFHIFTEFTKATNVIQTKMA